MPGESLFSIAQKFNLDMQEIIDLNELSDPDKFDAGGALLSAPAHLHRGGR